MFDFYQKYISTSLHALSRSVFGSQQGCRFSPTCSEYSKQAFKKYSFPKAALLSLIRLLRCNPLFPGGHDPLR